MSDPTTEQQGAVATAEPPSKPPAPPATGVAAPGPGPKKRRAGCWWAATIVAILVVIGLGLGLWWLLTPHSPQQDAVSSTSAFDSAMTKAMVNTSGAPAEPVELSTLQARGTHSFDATFTPDELTALVNAFPHDVVVGNTSVGLSNVTVAQTSETELSLSGTVASGDQSYSGKVTGEVAYVNGEVVATGPITVEAEGFTLPQAQAQTATQILLAYVNGYLGAAPGLTITEASVVGEGVHVKGLAPDSIEY